MAEKKPPPMIAPSYPPKCPVCGQSSYSSGGIHPQCAVAKADEPRKLRLAEEQKKLRDQPRKATVRSFNKKCPACKAEIHVRRNTCDCGHSFSK